MGASVLRVLAGVLASAAVAGGFVCAVAVVNPGGGPAPQWPASGSSQAARLSMPGATPGPADRARAFTPVLTPAAVLAAPAAAVAAPVVSKPAPAQPAAPAPAQPAPAQPATPAPAQSVTPAPAAPASPGPTPAPPRPLQQTRHAVGQTVAVTARTVAQTVAPVSPPVAATVQQTGDAVAAVVSGG